MINNQKSFFTVITYSSQGLGHLRVSYALESSAPVGISPILYSPDNELATALHRISSSNTFTRKLLLMSQNGVLEDLFTTLYKRYTKLGISKFEKKIDDLFTLSTVKLERLVFITTHFGLAHQLSVIKEKMKDHSCRIVLIVVVTDDSPQKVWYIPNADMTVVPSVSTKEGLERIAINKAVEHNIVVNPYPLHPNLTHMLNKKDYLKRVQMSQKDSKDIKILIPISGAAVGLRYTSQLVSALSESSDMYNFKIVSRRDHRTAKFLDTAGKRDSVTIISSMSDIEVVTEYDTLFLNTTFLYEITKPSEQAFKALAHPTQAGGVVLLLTEPVGRQEHDNLDFLMRNKLIPDEQTQKGLWKKAMEGKPPSKTMLKEATTWRGLRLPKNPRDASRFINWAHRNNIIHTMVLNKGIDTAMPNGTDEFWEKMKRFYIENDII